MLANRITLHVVVRIRPARLCEKATIHSERLAGDERGSIAEKEFHGVEKELSQLQNKLGGVRAAAKALGNTANRESLRSRST